MKDSMSHKVAFWLGIGIVVATHIYMLISGLPDSQMMMHAILNLIGAGLIVFAVMM